MGKDITLGNHIFSTAIMYVLNILILMKVLVLSQSYVILPDGFKPGPSPSVIHGPRNGTLNSDHDNHGKHLVKVDLQKTPLRLNRPIEILNDSAVDVTNKNDNGLSVQSLDLRLNVTNKNDGQDMYEVSRFLLQPGTRSSVLRAIVTNLDLKNPDVIRGLDNSLQQAFQKVLREAVHVGGSPRQ